MSRPRVPRPEAACEGREDLPGHTPRLAGGAGTERQVSAARPPEPRRRSRRPWLRGRTEMPLLVGDLVHTALAAADLRFRRVAANRRQ